MDLLWLIIMIAIGFALSGGNNKKGRTRQPRPGFPPGDAGPREERPHQFPEIFMEEEEEFPPRHKKQREYQTSAEPEGLGGGEGPVRDFAQERERLQPAVPAITGESCSLQGCLTHINRRRVVEGIIWSEILQPCRAKRPFFQKHQVMRKS